MPKTRESLYDIFSTGNKPTHDDFVDLIDSMINITDDGIGASEKGMPFELVEQGEKKRLLDFSQKKDTPAWRISALAASTSDRGLNISSADSDQDINRLFIKEDNGCVGVNTDAPSAKLHIKPGVDPALQVDDNAANSALFINQNGNMEIGSSAAGAAHELLINGAVEMKKTAIVTGKLTANNGLDVNNASLKANSGFTATGGATVNGMLTAQNGLTVNTATLAATKGATISGGALEAKNGLNVENGAVITTGVLEAKQGITVTGLDTGSNLAMSIAGKTVITTGVLEAQAGLTVSNAELTAQFGATISGALLNAQAGATVSNGLFKATSGAEISGGIIGLKVANGLAITGATTVADPSTEEVVFSLDTTNKKIEITGAMDFSAAGAVTLGNSSVVDPGIVIVNGELQAHNGASIAGETGTQVTVADGVTVSGGFIAADSVQLGNNSVDGTVTVAGKLEAANGADIGGLHVDASTGITINDPFTVNNQVMLLGDTTIKNLSVAEGISMPVLLLDSHAIITMTFTGTTTATPMVIFAQGTVASGHYGFALDADKQLTISYDETSDITNLAADWASFQFLEPQALDFTMHVLSSNSDDIMNDEINFSTTGTVYQEYTDPVNLLHVYYTGTETNAHVTIVENTDSGVTSYQCAVTAATITITYPVDPAQQVVAELLAAWNIWKSLHETESEFFEILGDDDHLNDAVVEVDIDLTENAGGNYFYQTQVKSNSLMIDGRMRFANSQVSVNDISGSSSLIQNSDQVLPTQKAVKSYVDAGLGTLTTALSGKADINGSASSDFAANNLTVNGTCTFDATEIDSLSTTIPTTGTGSATAITTESAVKSYVDNGLEDKADVSALDSKADKNGSIVENFSTNNLTVDGTFGFDATTTVDSLSKTIPTTPTATDTAIPTEKAVKTYVDNGLADVVASMTGQDVQKYLDIAFSGTPAIIPLANLNTSSMGMLIVYITEGSTSVSALYAIVGTNIISKIAGEGMADYILSYNGTNFIIYHDSGNNATADITYFGA